MVLFQLLGFKALEADTTRRAGSLLHQRRLQILLGWILASQALLEATGNIYVIASSLRLSVMKLHNQLFSRIVVNFEAMNQENQRPNVNSNFINKRPL